MRLCARALTNAAVLSPVEWCFATIRGVCSAVAPTWIARKQPAAPRRTARECMRSTAVDSTCTAVFYSVQSDFAAIVVIGVAIGETR